MNKFKILIASAAIIFTSQAFADGNEIITDISLDELNVLSSTYRSKERNLNLKKDLLIAENEVLKQTLEKLTKENEINSIRQAIKEQETQGSLVGFDNSKKEKTIKMFDFKEDISEEDILSQKNNWKQKVGFVYEDDLSKGIQLKETNLAETSFSSEKLDLDSLITELTTNNDEIKTNDSLPQNNVGESSFSLSSITLDNLVIYKDNASAVLVGKFLVNNGFQKINKTTKKQVTKGDFFDIDGKITYIVSDITKQGVSLTDQKSNEKTFIPR